MDVVQITLIIHIKIILYLFKLPKERQFCFGLYISTDFYLVAWCWPETGLYLSLWAGKVKVESGLGINVAWIFASHQPSDQLHHFLWHEKHTVSGVFRLSCTTRPLGLYKERHGSHKKRNLRFCNVYQDNLIFNGLRRMGLAKNLVGTGSLPTWQNTPELDS